MSADLWLKLMRCGLAADRPTAPDVVPNTTPAYLAKDTGVLSFWINGAWETAGGDLGVITTRLSGISQAIVATVTGGGVPAWVTALAAPGGDLPTVAADFANDRYYIAGTGEVAIGALFLNTSDDTPFAPGAEPEGYLGPDGLQGGFGDIYFSAAGKAAQTLVSTVILSIAIEADQPFDADFNIQDVTFNEIVEWDFTNDSGAPFPNAVRDLSGDQPDQPLTNLDALTVGPAKIGGTFSLTEVSGSINGQAAVLLDMLPALYSTRAFMVVQLIYGTWYTSLVVYPPQTDAHLATMTDV